MHSQSDQPSTEQKARLQQVADLMLEIYETLVEMRFIDPEGIVRGPHDIEDVRSLYRRYNLDPAIVYLYSILPYIDAREAGQDDFFHGSQFADFRHPGDIERGRDPYYASPTSDYEDENGEYMRPWVTPLDRMGNHSSVMIYDARLHRIWIFDQCGWNTTDPALVKYHSESEKSESTSGDDEADEDYMFGGNEADSSEDEEGTEPEEESEPSSAGSSEFWEDDEFEAEELDRLRSDQQEEVIQEEEPVDEPEPERPPSNNRNDFYHIRSRPADEFLRDVNRWYRELKELPGGGETASDLWREPRLLKPLYAKHGWPDNFDGDAFEVDWARTYGAHRAKYFAEEPLRQLQTEKSFLGYTERDIEKYTKALADAKDLDQTWKARFELWKVEDRRERNLKDLEKAQQKADRLCPGGICQKDGDLPLWELERLRVELQHALEAIPTEQDRARAAQQGSEDEKYFFTRVRHAKMKAEVYRKAYDESKVDAERLCPGRTFGEATGIKSLGRQDTLTSIQMARDSNAYSEQQLRKLKDWASRLPEGTPEASKAIERDVDAAVKELENGKDWLKRLQDWLAKHGSTD